jgi:transposase-like protein
MVIVFIKDIIMDITEVFERWPTQNDCIAYLEQVRWNNKPRCPYCKSINHTALPKEHRYHCNNCKTSFSVTVKTIFHKTHMPLQKWFLAVTLILNAKKGVSARQLARHIHVNRNTAWRISMQIRDAMYEPEQRGILQGLVEMDETYIGGKPRKSQKDRMNGKNFKRGHGTDKTPVVGMVERCGQVRAKVVDKHKITYKKLSQLVRDNVDLEKSVLITDEAKYYKGMKNIIPHKTINHSINYANGWIHTNSIESFWALLKRGIVGQFHKVSVKHLPQYLNEFCYRQNHREHSDVFSLTIQKAIGVI